MKAEGMLLDPPALQFLEQLEKVLPEGSFALTRRVTTAILEKSAGPPDDLPGPKTASEGAYPEEQIPRVARHE